MTQKTSISWTNLSSNLIRAVHKYEHRSETSRQNIIGVSQEDRESKKQSETKIMLAPKDKWDLVDRLVMAIQDMCALRYQDGKRDGEKFLYRLASNQLTVDDFNKHNRS